MVKKSIYSSFSTLYKLGKILGLLTFSFNSKRSEFVVQKKDLFITTVIILFLVIIQFYIFQKCQTKISDTESILYFLSNLDTCILTFFSSITLYLHKFKFIEIFKKIQLFDTQFHYQPQQNKTYQKYFILSTVNIIIYITINVVGYLLFYSDSTMSFICILAYFLSYLIVVCLRLIFVFFLTEIEYRLTFIESIKDQYTTLCKKCLATLFHVLKIINTVHNVHLLLNFLKIFIQILITFGYSLFLFTHSVDLPSEPTIQYVVLYFSNTFFWISHSAFELYSLIYYVEKLYAKV